MFQNDEKMLKNGWIADDNPIPHKLVVNGTDVSFDVQPKGCCNITDKRQIIVYNLLIYS